MLVLERKVGEELVFSNGLRLRLEEIGLDQAAFALGSGEGRSVTSWPFDQAVALAAGVSVKFHRRNSQRVTIAIDAPQAVRVLRGELESSSARRSRPVAGHAASGICCAGSR